MKIPIIINNCNLLEWPKKMIEDISTFEGVGEIIILDNGSTYEPLLEWYETKPCEIIKSEINYGQYGPWQKNIPQSLGSDYYVVTDPDLGLGETPKDCLLVLKEKLDKYKEFDRIGLSLSNIINRVYDTPYYYWLEHISHEFWNLEKLEDGLLKGHIVDTTFALYHKNRNKSGPSCATNFPYSARHLPWEFSNQEINNLKDINYEFYYYLKNANYACSFKRFVDFDNRCC
jgi:hypothetical protein